MNAENIKSEVESILIDECADFFEFVGGKGIMGRIFGFLVSNTEPVSLKDVSSRLKISKPAASNNLRVGLQNQMFKKVYNTDFPREDFYIVGGDIMDLMLEPGIKKLEYLKTKFQIAIDYLNKNYDEVKNDEKLIDLLNKLTYLIKTFEVVIVEYKDFGTRIKTKLDLLKEERNV